MGTHPHLTCVLVSTPAGGGTAPVPDGTRGGNCNGLDKFPPPMLNGLDLSIGGGNLRSCLLAKDAPKTEFAFGRKMRSNPRMRGTCRGDNHNNCAARWRWRRQLHDLCYLRTNERMSCLLSCEQKYHTKTSLLANKSITQSPRHERHSSQKIFLRCVSP